MTDFICSACKKRIAAQREGTARVVRQSAEAKELQTAGWPTMSIAEHFGVSFARARKLLRPGGVYGRGRVRLRRTDKIRELRKTGVSAVKIAKKMKCCVTTVYRALES